MFESLSSTVGIYPDRKNTKFYESETGKSVHREYSNITGTDTKVFTNNFIKVLDSAIINNNKYLLTKEQVAFFDTYCEEADDVLSPVMLQFDTFLGSYMGGTNV
jgi:hypothetical protein